MKKLLCAVALLAPVAAFATPVPGAYVQAAAGWNDVFTKTAYNFDSKYLADGYTGALAVGYLWGCDFQYGVELGGQIYPDSKASTLHGVNIFTGNPVSATAKVDGYNIDLLGVAKYNFDNGFNVFGKLGAAYVSQKYSADYSGDTTGLPTGSNTENGFAPEVALGVGYQINQNIEVNLTTNLIYRTDNATKGDNGPYSNANVLLGVTYHFA